MRPPAFRLPPRSLLGLLTHPPSRLLRRCLRALHPIVVLATAMALSAPIFAQATPPPQPLAVAVPNIAAASDLQFVLTQIAADFTRDTGAEVKLVFGSSGNFRQQIAQGAPFEMFLSADEAYVEALAGDARTEDGGTLYATGRLALFVPAGSPLAADPELAGLRRGVADGRVKRFAIANPEHAPYGRAAREALQKVGLWEALLPRLVQGENVSQAAQFALSGGAQGGIIAYSLALSPALAGRGIHVLLPEALHAPLRQRMVLLRGAGPTARALYRYLQEPRARAAFKRSGFVLPGEKGE